MVFIYPDTYSRTLPDDGVIFEKMYQNPFRKQVFADSNPPARAFGNPSWQVSSFKPWLNGESLQEDRSLVNDNLFNKEHNENSLKKVSSFLSDNLFNKEDNENSLKKVSSFLGDNIFDSEPFEKPLKEVGSFLNDNLNKQEYIEPVKVTYMTEYSPDSSDIIKEFFDKVNFFREEHSYEFIGCIIFIILIVLLFCGKIVLHWVCQMGACFSEVLNNWFRSLKRCCGFSSEGRVKQCRRHPQQNIDRSSQAGRNP